MKNIYVLAVLAVLVVNVTGCMSYTPEMKARDEGIKKSRSEYIKNTCEKNPSDKLCVYQDK